MKTAKLFLHTLVGISTVFYTLAVALLGVPSIANAQVPTSIGYNGRLFNASGSALTGTYYFWFDLESALTGGTTAATNIQATNFLSTPTSAITVTNGFFSLQIPLGTDLSAFSDNLFLEIKVASVDLVGSAETLSPRVEVTKVPYSIYTQAVETVSSAPTDDLFDGRMYYNTATDLVYVYRNGAWSPLSTSFDDAYNGDTLERTVAVDVGDLSFDLSGTASFAIDTTTGTGDILFQDAGTTWVTFSDGQAITTTGSSAISLTSTDSNISLITSDADNDGDKNIVLSSGNAAPDALENGNDVAIEAEDDILLESTGDVIVGSGAAFNVDTLAGISLDADTASNFSTSAGALTIDGAGGVNIVGNAAEVDVTTTGALDLNSAAGTWDSSAGISLDAATASNFSTAAGDLTLAAAAASVVIQSAEDADDSIYLDADGTSGGGIFIDAYDATTNTTGIVTLDGAAVQINTYGSIAGLGNAGLDINVGSSGTLSMATTNGAISLSGGGASGGVNVTSALGAITLDTQTGSQSISLGTSDVARTINLGTGTGADTFNFGAGADQFNFVSTETSNNAVDMTFNSLTTGSGLALTATSLTSGNAVDLTLAGTTGSAINITDTAQDGAAALLDLNMTDATVTAQSYVLRGTYADNDDANADFLLFEDAGGTQFAIAHDGSTTVTGTEGSNALTLTTGDVAVSNGSLSVTDNDNAVSFDVTNNTATTIGLGASTGVVSLASTSLTTGSLLNLQLTEGTLAGGYYLRAWDATGGAEVFKVGEDGNTTIAGTALGTDALTLSAGDVLISSGNFDLSAGDFNVFLIDGQYANLGGDGTPTQDLLWLGRTDTSSTDGVDALFITSNVSGASGTGVHIDPSFTTGVADDYSVMSIDAFGATTTANVASNVKGLDIGNLTETENTLNNITSVAIDIGTGWDVGLSLGSSLKLDDGVALIWGTDNDVSAAWDNADAALEFTGGLVSIGNDAGGATATGANDLFVAGDLEVDVDTDLDGNLSVADTNVAFDGASTTFTTTGAFTLTPGGAMAFGDGGDSFAVNTTEFDIAAATGSITIDDDGDAGNVMIDGTRYDINSIDFVGGGNINTIGQLVLDTDATGNLSVIGSQAAANAVRIVADDAAGGIDVDAGTAGIAIDSTGAISLDSAAASNFTVATNAAGEDLTLAITGATDSSILLSSSGTGTDAIGLTASAGGITIDASGAIDLNSTGGAINIGNDADANAVNIATGAAARVITIGNAASASLALEAGVGAFTALADTTMDLDAGGALSLNSSAGAINIGNDNVNQNISVGTSGVRTIAVGNASATAVNIDALALSLDAAGGSSNLSLAANSAADDLTIAVTGAYNSSLLLSSSGTGADAMTLTTTAGGLDISVTGDAAGEDLDISALGATTEMRLSTASTEADAFRLNASAGGIDIDATNSTFTLTNTANGAGDDFTIAQAGAFDSSLLLTSAGTGTDAIGLTASAGGITIDASGAIDINSTAGAINIGNDADANAINIGTGIAARTITIGNNGATAIAINSGNDITVTPGTATDVFNVATGNLTVGAGVPDTALDGVDAYITGTLEVDGATNFDGAADFSAGITNSAGEFLVSGGNMQFNDARVLSFGTTDDVQLVWDDAGGALEISNGLVVIGGATGGATATGANDLLVKDALEVDGATDLDGSLDVDGVTNLDQVTIDTTDGAFSVGGANTITLGNNNGTVSIDSNDWNITTDGTMSGIGAINGGVDLFSVSAAGAVLGASFDSSAAAGLSIGATNATSIAIGTATTTTTTLDGVALSLDAAGGSSNLTLAANSAADDLTIAVTGAYNSSLILSSAGTATDALTITATDSGNSGTANLVLGAGNVRPDAGEDGNDIVLEAEDDILLKSTGAISLDGATVSLGTAATVTTSLDGAAFSLDAAGGSSNLSLEANSAADDLTIAVTGAYNSSLLLSSSGTGADAMTLTTTAGGLDISVTGDAAGEDLDISALGATTEMRLSTASTEADAFRLNASAGGIDIDATNSTFTLTNTANGAGDDFTIAQAGAFNASLLLTSAGTGTDAIGLDATAGSISINASDAGNAGDDNIIIKAGNAPYSPAVPNGDDIEIAAEGTTTVSGGFVDIKASNSIDIASNTSYIGIGDTSGNSAVNIGGVNNDYASIIRISTEATSADTITIGNSHASTTIALTGGDDWSITAAGVATFELNSNGGATFAVCHVTNGTQTEALQDCNGGAAADYAERYPTAAGVTYGQIVVPGTTMVTTNDPNHGEQQIAQAVLSTQPYQGPVYGIVSNNYDDFTSAGNNVDEIDNPMPVALVGRVPVKVVAENGSIAIGDFLATSSTPGAAMKATQAGRVIGMAMENWNGEKDTVMVQVINTWYQPSVLQGGSDELIQVVDGLSVADGDFSGSVTVAEHLYGSHDMAGRVRLASGKDKVVVTFEKPFAEGSTPIITFSSRSNSDSADGAWVSAESTTGFTINRANSEAEVEFNWIAIGVYDAQVTVSDDYSDGVNISVNDPNSPSAPAPVEPSDEVEEVAPEAEEVVEDVVVEEPGAEQPAE